MWLFRFKHTVYLRSVNGHGQAVIHPVCMREGKCSIYIYFHSKKRIYETRRDTFFAGKSWFRNDTPRTRVNACLPTTDNLHHPNRNESKRRVLFATIQMHSVHHVAFAPTIGARHNQFDINYYVVGSLKRLKNASQTIIALVWPYIRNPGTLLNV